MGLILAVYNGINKKPRFFVILVFANVNGPSIDCQSDQGGEPP